MTRSRNLLTNRSEFYSINESSELVRYVSTFYLLLLAASKNLECHQVEVAPLLAISSSQVRTLSYSTAVFLALKTTISCAGTLRLPG